MRVLFFGTSEFALPTLDALLSAHEVVGVVTQPDRPAGRGQKLLPSPVKQLAVDRKITVLQPEKIREPGWVEQLQALNPEVSVVAAFGQILPKAVLNLPARGSINVHASLLPKYRGAAPIAWALMNGESETGITTFLMDEGMDTGPILLQQSLAILPEENAGALSSRLARLGADLLSQTLKELLAGRLRPKPQDHGRATLAPRLKKNDGFLDWRLPARMLVNRVRGLTPRPGAFTSWKQRRLDVLSGEALPAKGHEAPGTLAAHGSTVAIQAGDGLFLPHEVQPESRHTMRWDDFLRGARAKPGDQLGGTLPEQV
jgi:methionyl-tRNA formyltransferase